MKIIMLSFVLSIQGCSSFFDEKYDRDNLLEKVDTLQGINESKQKPFMMYSEPYLGKSVNFSSEKKAILDKMVNISSYSPIDINTVLEMLHEQTGITYKLSTSMLSDEKNVGSSNSDNDDYYYENKKSSNNSESFQVKFSGTLSDFLTYVSSLYDINLELTNENLLLATKYKNFAISLDFYGQDNQYETGLNVGSNEGTSSGGFTGKTETKFSSSFWNDIGDLVKSNVSSGVYTIFKDASILTIVAKNSEYQALKKVIDEYQKANSKQFVVSYKIYILDKNKLVDLNSNLGFKFSDHGTNIDLNNSGILDSIAGKITSTTNFNGGDNPKFVLGAQLDALYKLTGKEILQSGTFVTRNNTPIPLNMTNSRYFVSGRSQTLGSGSSDFLETQITTDQVITGTSFIITPRVMSDGNIEVVSGFTKRTLDKMDSFGDSKEAVMLPTVSSIEMFNTSLMRPGSIAIVSEFNTDEESDGSTFEFLSFGKDGENRNSTAVMVVGIDYYNSYNKK